MRRRGHITQSSPGVWRIVASYKDATGTWRRKWHTIRGSRKEADQTLTQMLAQLDSGKLPTGEKRTISHLMDEWLESKSRTAGSKTLKEYRQKVRVYIDSNPFGKLQAQKVTPMNLEAFYKQLEERGGANGRPLSGRTVLHVHRHLRDAFSLAVRRGYLSINPADLVDPPSPGDYTGSSFTAEEVRRLLAQVKGTRLEAPVLLAASCGLRRGEVLALRWQDIDLNAGHVAVRHSIDEKGQLKTPKTRTSQRVLPLPAFAIRTLQVIKGEQAQRKLKLSKIYASEDWVCCDEMGRLLRPNYITDAFHQLCDEAGVPRLRFHDLRHTHSTLLAQSGHSLQLVAARMGHSTIATTANIYTHLVAKEDNAGAKLLDDLFCAQDSVEISVDSVK